jgi:hypothetical protein
MIDNICTKQTLPVACSISGRSLRFIVLKETDVNSTETTHFECDTSDICHIYPVNIPSI